MSLCNYKRGGVAQCGEKAAYRCALCEAQRCRPHHVMERGDLCSSGTGTAGHWWRAIASLPQMSAAATARPITRSPGPKYTGWDWVATPENMKIGDEEAKAWMEQYGGKWLSLDIETNVETAKSIFYGSLGKEVREKMLDKLKTFSEERASVDEMVELDAYAHILSEAYGRNQITVPEWLVDVKGRLANAIVARQRDTWEKELKETERELDRLKSAEEKRTEKAARLAELKAKLGR